MRVRSSPNPRNTARFAMIPESGIRRQFQSVRRATQLLLRLGQSASTSSTAAAQLLTTIAASAPGQPFKQFRNVESRFPARLLPGHIPDCYSLSRFRRISSSAAPLSGALPRFVCNITPVA